MAEFPDVYGEVFSITAGPAGCIITIAHILPTGETVPHEDPTEIVARIRVSLPVAKMLLEGLQQTLTAAEKGIPQTQLIRH
jgi:hypothetical protein